MDKMTVPNREKDAVTPLTVPFSKPSVGEEEIEAVSRVLRSGWLAAGEETAAFEQEFSDYVGVEYAIFTNSCTAALKMAYNIAKELGVQGIYYPQNTFVATYSAAAELGLVTCPIGGYDGDIWRLYPCTNAQSVDQNSKIHTTATEGNSVALRAIEKAGKGLGSLQVLSSSQEKELVLQLNSKVAQEKKTIKEKITTQNISGLNGTTEEQMSVMSVAQLRRLVGQTKTTTIPSNVINGRDYALNATMSTTMPIMASTVVHYGSIRDNSPCLIEDSAHRIEKDDPLTGLIRCYSFYATKNMSCGSGGMFVTNNKEVYERARLYWKDGLSTSTSDRLQSMAGYEVLTLVSGYDGNDIAAAMGREQLKKLPEFTLRRNDICRKYNVAFNQDWTGNHLYPYFLKDEAEVYRAVSFLKEKGVSASHHYPGTGWNGLSLPLYPSMTDAQVDYVITSVKEYAAQAH